MIEGGRRAPGAVLKSYDNLPLEKTGCSSGDLDEEALTEELLKKALKLVRSAWTRDSIAGRDNQAERCRV